MKVRVYTDGACLNNPGSGGWAVAFNMATKCETIAGGESDVSNNRMELKAMIEAYKMALKKANEINYDINVEIYTDSAYVVNSINNGWVDRWRFNEWRTTRNVVIKNRDLWEEFTELRSKTARHININDIRVIKIKGHSGDTFNELVDKLAKREAMKIKSSCTTKWQNIKSEGGNLL